MGIVALAFAVIAYITGRVDFSSYLNTIYLPGSGELTIYCMAFAGASLGFLWFNAKPAQVFMGDTGSLSMGSAIATLAVLLKKEILFIILRLSLLRKQSRSCCRLAILSGPKSVPVPDSVYSEWRRFTIILK